MKKTAQTAAQVAEAGRRGADLRSDCWVKVTLTGSGGIEIALKSKVDSLYGESIRQLVRSVRENPRHQETSPFTSYNCHCEGCFASMVDATILRATEVDVEFNANVVAAVKWVDGTVIDCVRQVEQ